MNDPNPVSDALVWAAGGTIAESPVWDARYRRVLFADMEGGRVLGYGVDDGSREEWHLHQRVGSFGLCRSGRLVVALSRQLVFLDLADGSIEPLTGELDEPATNRLNDGRPGPDGCYWVGSIDGRCLEHGTDRASIRDPTGSLYRISPDGSIERRSTGYLISNGIAFSPDGRTMYATRHLDGESANRVIEAWDFDPATGNTTNQRHAVVVDPEDGLPDGAAVDVDGCYWSAGISAGRINQFSPSGELITRIRTPCSAPTMPCFADGALFVTSMRRSDAPTGQGNVAGLFRLRAPTSGAAVAVFAD